MSRLRWFRRFLRDLGAALMLVTVLAIPGMLLGASFATGTIDVWTYLAAATVAFETVLILYVIRTEESSSD